MRDLAVNHYARCGHHAIAHDLGHVSDFLELDLYTCLPGRDGDQIGCCFAVLAAGTEHLDVLHPENPLKINAIRNSSNRSCNSRHHLAVGWVYKARTRKHRIGNNHLSAV